MWIPKAPEWTPTNILRAVAVGVGMWVATLGLGAIWSPLALIPSLLLLAAAIYLIGGELWQKRHVS